MKRIILILLFAGSSLLTMARPGYAVLSGRLNFAKDGQTVDFYINPYGFDLFRFSDRKYTATVKNHFFSFKIPVDHGPVFIFLKSSSWGANQIVNGQYFLEKDDNVLIDELSRIGYVHFSGKGSAKLNLTYQLSEIENFYLRSIPNPPHASDVKAEFEMTDSLISDQLEYLNGKKQELSSLAYLLIRTNIVSTSLGKFNLIGGEYGGVHGKSIDSALVAVKDYHDHLSERFWGKGFKNSELSEPYIKSIIIKYTYDSCTVRHQAFSVNKCYNFIKTHFSGGLRERLITYILFYHQQDAHENIAESVNDAFHYVYTADFVIVLQKLKSNRVTGLPAFNFNLPDIKGVRHSMEDYKGKVVFIDFWFRSCGNCIRVSPYLEKIEKHFQGAPVVFLSINVDNKRSDWIWGIESGKYSSDYAINLYTENLGFKHPICLHYAVDAGPTLVLIDKKGRLLTNPVDPRTDDGQSLTAQITEALTK
jgi:thiol-disulfide isomerase/thioredoxin